MHIKCNTVIGQTISIDFTLRVSRMLFSNFLTESKKHFRSLEDFGSVEHLWKCQFIFLSGCYV